MYAIFNGKRIDFDKDTVFTVQSAKPTDKFQTRWTFPGNPSQAAFYFDSINLGPGFSKRLLMGKKVLVKISEPT